MNIEIFSEICCDECGDVIHNHFDCPACKQFYAGTECYAEIPVREIGFSLSCESCDAKFRIVEFNEDLWQPEWEMVDENRTI
jgi:hypothetical protein